MEKWAANNHGRSPHEPSLGVGKGEKQQRLELTLEPWNRNAGTRKELLSHTVLTNTAHGARNEPI